MVPFAAVRDALDRFDADLIVISTHPATRSRWLRKDLVEQVRWGCPSLVQKWASHARAGTSPPRAQRRARLAAEIKRLFDAQGKSAAPR